MAARSLARDRAATTAAVLTLGLGLGAATAVWSVLWGLLLRPLPFATPHRLVEVVGERGGQRERLSMRELEDLRALPAFSAAAAYVPGVTYTLAEAAGAEQPPSILTTHDLFDVLGVPPALGSTFPADLDRSRGYGVLISHQLWRRQFGADPRVIGKTVALDASPSRPTAYTIHGVLPPGFEFPPGTEIYRALFISPMFPNLEDRAARNVRSVLRLAPGVSRGAAQQQVSALGRRLAEEFPESNRETRLLVVPLDEVFRGELRPYVAVLAAAAFLVLGIAVLNVANLLLSRSLAREGELAVRVALGASRGRLAAQVLLEALLVALAGGVLGSGIAALGLSALERWVGFHLPPWMRLEVDGGLLAAALVLAVAAGLAAGIIPALRSGGGAMGVLRAGGRGAVGGGRRQRLKEALVVVEVTLAVALLVGAGLAVRTVQELHGAELGFSPRGLYTFQLSLPWTYTAEEVTGLQRALGERLRALPGVTAVTTDTLLPLTAPPSPETGLVRAEGQSEADEQRQPAVRFHRVGAGYFETLGIPLLAGRGITGEEQKGGSPVAVVGQRVARLLWPGQDPLGRRLRVRSFEPEPSWLTVVGVAGDVRGEGPHAGSGHDVYVPLEQLGDSWTFFALRTTRDPAELAGEARRVLQELDPTQPMTDGATLEERRRALVWRQHAVAVLLGGFAVATLLLSLTGIYGVMAHSVTRRTREAGLRMALGAVPGQLFRQIVTEALGLVAAGLLVGLGLALPGGMLVRHLLFGVHPLDPATLMAVGLAFLLTGLVAAWVPARRAMRVAPMEALRRE
jgi:putative ABC transport system permease protein